jgi:hypothetical protein
MVVLAHLRRRWSLSGGEGFEVLSPSRRACERRIQVFSRKWNAYFPLRRRREKVAKVQSVSLWKTLTGRWTRRVRSVQRGTSTRVCNRRIRSLTKPERPVGHPEEQSVARSWPDARRVRSHAIGRVQSREELSGLRSDAGCSASGQMVNRVRSQQRLSLTRTATVLSCSDWTRPVTLTGASGYHIFHYGVL